LRRKRGKATPCQRLNSQETIICNFTDCFLNPSNRLFFNIFSIVSKFGTVRLQIFPKKCAKNPNCLKDARLNRQIVLNNETTRAEPRQTRMTGKSKFIASVVKTAKSTSVELPWSRGARRDDFIIKRSSKAVSLKRA